MAKSANLYARIEPERKEESENIHLPFAVKLPTAQPVDIRTLTANQLNMELEKGYTDLSLGHTKPAPSVFDAIRKDFSV